MDTDIPLTAQIAELRRRFSYNPETGILTRKVAYYKQWPVGSQVGCSNGKHLQTRVGERHLLVHVIAYVLMTGEFPPKQIDHKNGNRLDNRWENLRLATNSQNGMNKGPNKNKKSGLPKGVYRRSRGEGYVAKLSGKTIKYTQSIEAAKAAYDAAAREKYGEFASG